MKADTLMGDAPEKDRWWLVGLSISYQQLMFLGALSIFLRVHIASSILALPIVLIWVASFVFPLPRISPHNAKSRFRSYAKAGWLYVLAAFAWSMCVIIVGYFYLSPGLSITR
jgi:hypothetical protein